MKRSGGEAKRGASWTLTMSMTVFCLPQKVLLQPHKVNIRFLYKQHVSYLVYSLADVEAEEVDLGNSVEDDLAFDVDENMDHEEDSEGLESDDDDKLDEELGLEEGSDSKFIQFGS